MAKPVETPPEPVQRAETLATPMPTPTPVISAPAASYAPIDSSDAKLFIYMRESGNNPGSINASSGACSLGQALPCSKLAAVCPNWQVDYACDDAWFTNYAVSRYGGWEQARQWWLNHSWW